MVFENTDKLRQRGSNGRYYEHVTPVTLAAILSEVASQHNFDLKHVLIPDAQNPGHQEAAKILGQQATNALILDSSKPQAPSAEV